jgi:hypothetical protein
MYSPVGAWPCETADAKWEFIRDGLSRFAGRSLVRAIVDRSTVAEVFALYQ